MSSLFFSFSLSRDWRTAIPAISELCWQACRLSTTASAGIAAPPHLACFFQSRIVPAVLIPFLSSFTLYVSFRESSFCALALYHGQQLTRVICVISRPLTFFRLVPDSLLELLNFLSFFLSLRISIGTYLNHMSACYEKGHQAHSLLSWSLESQA